MELFQKSLYEENKINDYVTKRKFDISGMVQDHIKLLTDAEENPDNFMKSVYDHYSWSTFEAQENFMLHIGEYIKLLLKLNDGMWFISGSYLVDPGSAHDIDIYAEEKVIDSFIKNVEKNDETQIIYQQNIVGFKKGKWSKILQFIKIPGRKYGEHPFENMLAMIQLIHLMYDFNVCKRALVYWKETPYLVTHNSYSNDDVFVMGSLVTEERLKRYKRKGFDDIKIVYEKIPRVKHGYTHGVNEISNLIPGSVVITKHGIFTDKYIPDLINTGTEIYDFGRKKHLETLEEYLDYVDTEDQPRTRKLV